MKKTTVYLPEELKQKVEAMAREGKKSEADVIRDAISSAYEEKRTYPKPRLPLVPGLKLGRPDIAEKADELLDRFGE